MHRSIALSSSSLCPPTVVRLEWQHSPSRWKHELIYPVKYLRTSCVDVFWREWLLLKKNRITGLTAMQKRYRFDCKKLVSNTPVFKWKELVFINRPLVALRRSHSKITDRPTHNKQMLRVDGPLRILIIQQHTLTIYKNGVLNTRTAYQATHVPPRQRELQCWKRKKLQRRRDSIY